MERAFRDPSVLFWFPAEMWLQDCDKRLHVNLCMPQFHILCMVLWCDLIDKDRDSLKP